MPFKIVCPNGHAMMVLEQHAGRRVKCPTCNTGLIAPDSGFAEPVSAPSHETPRRADVVRRDDYEARRPRAAGRRGRQSERELEPHRGSTVLVLGILSFFVAMPILGPIAWVMGHSDLKKMRAGRMDRSGERDTNAGRICGMISTLIAGVLLAGMLVLFLILLIGGMLASHEARQPYTAPPAKAKAPLQVAGENPAPESPRAAPPTAPRRKSDPPHFQPAPPPAPPPADREPADTRPPAKPASPPASAPPAPPAAPSDDGWQELATSDKRVRVLVPKAPSTQSSTVDATVNGVKLRLDLTIAGGENSAFGVALVTIPKDGRARTPEQHLNLLRDGMLQRVSARLTSEKRITFGAKKHPGRELVADFFAEGRPMRLFCRTYIIGDSGVCLLATTDPNANLTKEIERFYKSFEWEPEAAKAKEPDKK